MQRKPLLSLVIVCQDEERIIGKVLSSAKGLNPEIVIVDSGSKDKTIEIAKSYGAQVVHQDWLGYAAQKNFALGLASGEWILSLDADEIMTPELVSEIKHALLRPDINEFDGFKIGRILFIGDRAIKYGGFSPDPRLRLFRRSKGKFNNRLVHEAVFVPGRVANLKNHILHYSYCDLNEFAFAMNKFAALSAQESMRSGYSSWKVSLLNELLHPCWTFFYRYIFRRGFLDGLLGLKMNLIYSNYVRCKISYLRDLVKNHKS